MTYEGHIPLTRRGPGIYAKPRRDDAIRHLVKYVRMVDPQTDQQMEHLLAYGSAFLPRRDVATIIKRVVEQSPLYADY